jgi:hypothetical protein
MKIPTVETVPEYLSASIANLLHHIITENAQLKDAPVKQNCLFSTPWKYDWVQITDYVDRLKEWIVCGTESYVVALIFFRRLEAMGALPVINSLTVHRIFFACLMLAVKVTEDETLNNADFAKVACIQLKDLNNMEIFILESFAFCCTVTTEEFVQCKRELIHIDLLLSKAKAGRVNDLQRLGRMQDPSAPLYVNTMLGDLKGVAPKKYFAATIPFFKEKRRCSSDAVLVAAPPAEGESTKSSLPNMVPSFVKRRVSLEMFRAKSAAPPVGAKRPNLVRQDST